MTSAILELQKAVFAALSGDAALVGLLGGARIYDHVPPTAPFPYLTLGGASTFDWSTATEGGAEHFITLNVWSKGRGKAEVLELAALAQAALGEPMLALDGHSLVNLRHEGTQTSFDDDLSVHRAAVRFRAVTEPS